MEDAQIFFTNFAWAWKLKFEYSSKQMHGKQGVQGISDIITIPGLVNVDFADVCAIMSDSGTAMLGVGIASGKNRAEEAAMVWIFELFFFYL